MKKTSILLVFFLLFFIHITNAESEYTREKSEELFHLLDWHEYSPGTFNKAIEEQKPIYLVISAPAWCYWCHVYESKDYLYHPNLYPYINDNFISIFVDSDKRPDLTRKYLEGGWPSTTIFTPNMMRINGFTGPKDSTTLREYLESVVQYLEGKIFADTSTTINYQEISPSVPTLDKLNLMGDNFLAYILDQFDPVYGGIGIGDLPEWREGQKFPKGFALKYLLEKYDETKNQQFLDIVKTTFDNQYTKISEIKTKYHLYDPVEGGFHRYSTKRDWSVPHYEKMLPDQAKLIRTYAHLLKITNNADAETAINGSISFVINKFYDKEGGFYSSQDAYLEEEYFELLKEEREKIEPPYIDKTRKMDSNSMMISTFIYLYDVFGNPEYKKIAKKSLDFLKNNMISEEGVYYYFDFDKKESFLTGQALANSWSILAFIEGYESFGEKVYLETAEEIADYSLSNLYDWKSGGFFERNSKDADFYAPNERVDLSKPYGENAVFSYSMIKLYLITENLEYLESGLKTLDYLIDRTSGLEETYYLIKASHLIKNNNLIDVYEGNEDTINNLMEQRKKNFFLDDLLEKHQNNVSLDDIPKLKDEFSNIGLVILIILAFSAGILSFLSPCTLPILTAYFAHNLSTKKGETVMNTIAFFLGLALVFSIFGMGATLFGNLLRDYRVTLTQIAGFIIILFGILQIFGKGFSGLHIKMKGKKKTPYGSFIFGAVFGIGWSACIGPILASLLLLSATSGTIFKGSILLFIYSLGLGLPLIFISIYFDKIKKKRFWSLLQGKMIKFSIMKRKFVIHSTYLISGLILIIIGALIFNDYLYKLNQITLQTNYVQNFIIKAEEFLKNLFLR